MSFNLFNRRLHLYLALVLLPWFTMYGVSSIPFAHKAWFNDYYGSSTPTFTKRFDDRYVLNVPPRVATPEALRPLGEQVLADLGLEDRLFHVGRPKPDTLNIYAFNFRNATNIVYSIPDQRLVAQDRAFRWDNFLTGMHARGGFQQPSLVSDLWGVVVDIVCVGMFLWIATGLYMWWLLKRTRGWGTLALAAGVASAALFVTAL